MGLPDELRLGETPDGYRSGFVSLVGRPNVGKSTLLNQILRSKVAITSERPQTTRNAIRGILTTSHAQLVFVDTPGLHKPVTTLGQRLNQVARSTIGEVDVVVFVVDAADGVGAGDAFIADVLRQISAPVVVALNKVDLIGSEKIDKALAKVREMGDWPAFAVSARVGAGLPELLGALTQRLPPGPLYYPPDALTDQPERQLIAELVREQLLELTREEVPHSIAVVVEELFRDDGRLTVDAIVFVERDSQRGIVIGRGGSMLKQIGTRARRQIESLLGEPVYLHLRVKVERDWQRRAAAVERFGYGS